MSGWCSEAELLLLPEATEPKQETRAQRGQARRSYSAGDEQPVGGLARDMR